MFLWRGFEGLYFTAKLGQAFKKIVKRSVIFGLTV